MCLQVQLLNCTLEYNFSGVLPTNDHVALLMLSLSNSCFELGASKAQPTQKL